MEESNEVLCECGVAARHDFTKKAGPNHGKGFFGCSNYPNGCKFFQWSKESVKEEASAVPSPKKQKAASSEEVEILKKILVVLEGVKRNTSRFA